MKKLYGIFGAGGFGRELMPVAREQLLRMHGAGGFEIVFVEPELRSQDDVNRCKVITERQFMESTAAEKYFNVALGDSRVRQRIAESQTSCGANPFSIVAANSLILDENSIGEGAVICPYSMVTSNAKIGRFFQCNIYSYVAHDCEIGDFVTFAPSVHCNGRVVVEDHAYIGTGAILRHGTDEKPLVIGRGAVVGMGAVVTKNVAPGAVVVGNPAVPRSTSPR